MIDLLAITSTNAGGHIAHIGGALFGIRFAARIKEGKDLTAPMNRLLDWVVNLGKRKPKMRVTYKRPRPIMNIMPVNIGKQSIWMQYWIN